MIVVEFLSTLLSFSYIHHNQIIECEKLLDLKLRNHMQGKDEEKLPFCNVPVISKFSKGSFAYATCIQFHTIISIR